MKAPLVAGAVGPLVTIGQASHAGGKPSNDDSYGVMVPLGIDLTTKGIAMAIADGVSSSAAAKEASENCVKLFLTDYYATHASWPVKRSVGVVLKAANAWLHAQGQRHAGGMATTFSGVVLKAGVAHVFHAGDSRIGLLRDGRIEPLTRDHRGGLGPDAKRLSRAVGADEHLEVDYRTEPLARGDILVFTTDGVHDNQAAAEQARLIAERAGDLDGAARAIIEAALARGADDNLTCQLALIEDPGIVDAESRLHALGALPFPPDLAPGMVFEGYTIQREISASKRGQVYLAIDTGSGERVALKTPSVNFEDDPAYIEIFAREEWIGRLITSPHVLKVPPATRSRRQLFTVTEFFDAQTLRQWMHDHPRPELETVRGIVEQIAKGLRALHRKDIVHGDLKPDNIMIDRAGLVKIIDFGSARSAGLDEAAPGATIPGGTVDYTAPECVLGGQPTPASDMFAIGVIAYEMLTGTLPYGRGFAKPSDIGRRTYRPAGAMREDVPGWMDGALRKAVAVKLTDRTEALSELITDLRQPNRALAHGRSGSLLDRDPVAFWRAIAVVELVMIVAVLVLAW